jgi:4-amino-4-deoxy-L-arabinose transferase-like glycosyltransferase
MTNNKALVVFVGIIVCFTLLHLVGLGQPYHQDEYKWPIIVNPALTEPGGIPHPPVGEFIYRQAGFLVGYDNFRLIPAFFGLLNLLLLFYLVKNIFDTKTALWSVGIFALSFYSLLASLMVDTDGAIMPFFFLIMTICYAKLRAKSFELRGKEFKWLATLVLAATLGFLVKASFIIGIGALALDFIFEKGVFGDKKKVLKYIVLGLGIFALLIILLFLSKLIFPFFNLQSSISYWSHFVKFSGRGWMQTFIQFVKALLYLSPLLVLTPFLVAKEDFKKVRPFIFFIVLGLFFYVILFDFSAGALDRYLQFLVVPLCVISGAVIVKTSLQRGEVAFPIILSTAVFSLQFFNHYVPPLYPKSEWVSRVFSLKWNFLYPFSGGSGPLGFYVSFMVIGLFWIIGMILLLTYFKNKNLKSGVVVGLLVVSIFYNGIFIEEYLFGKINGSARDMVRQTLSFVRDNPDIEKVVVYNDNGGFEVMKTGKYARRLYATPQFEGTYRDFFKKFSGHVMYVNIPRVAEGTFYAEYLDSCREIFKTTDRYLESRVLDCRGGQ